LRKERIDMSGNTKSDWMLLDTKLDLYLTLN